MMITHPLLRVDGKQESHSGKTGCLIVPVGPARPEFRIPFRTARRGLARHRRNGAIGLARPGRRDMRARRSPAARGALIEGTGLMKPRPTRRVILTFRWTGRPQFSCIRLTTQLLSRRCTADINGLTLVIGADEERVHGGKATAARCTADQQ